jgi:hypothetical protein
VRSPWNGSWFTSTQCDVCFVHKDVLIHRHTAHVCVTSGSLADADAAYRSNCGDAPMAVPPRTRSARAPRAACPGVGMPSPMEDEPPKATAVRLATGPMGWPVGRGWASLPARDAQSMTLLGGAP